MLEMSLKLKFNISTFQRDQKIFFIRFNPNRTSLEIRKKTEPQKQKNPNFS